MNNFKALTLLIPVLFLISSCATETTPLNINSENSTESNVTLAATEPFSYQNYQQILSIYVDENGNVNYKALKENRQNLDKFNASLATLSPQSFENWTEKEKIAFWINAYNSLTLLAIIENYPTKSIRDIPGVWTKLQFNVMGKEVTLDEIEHKILRVQFNEPRIHMGLVCASIGCPLLLQEPYTGDKLDEQLDEQTRKFIALNQNFKIDKQNNQVYLSSIFKWFGEDFIPSFKAQDKFTGSDKERAVLNFVSQYLNESEQKYLINEKYQIKYLDYDWSLNDK
ncbi:DUF547 domain-containing protein [Limnoraphis robusta]|uniref:DUF547 domain-containing protein n=1 Tax=Limnoraphis robusta CCNP1315 TaxID=3110306 RepID=A0ABU5TZ54_9CYAN|nr:DUF547 domain-containing protein [Limnoraphis robusta]MEA5520217.1 DUF547 domain-containing protein [Limnoraphis robusta CCNP1315]MEA5546729.1 DUF547 domain-containing protein [Limnoraphis robusta CCNP1324]